MGIKSTFRKIAGKPYQTFAETEEMVTRPLPVLGAKNNWMYIQFVAKQDKSGRWNISYNSNDIWYLESMAGFKPSLAAMKAAIKKHSADDPVNDKKMNFDAAFLALREVEETLLKHGAEFPVPREPSRHYMQAYRFLPKSFQEGLDDLYQTRLTQGEILPPKTSKPANKPPESPKQG